MLQYQYGVNAASQQKSVNAESTSKCTPSAGRSFRAVSRGTLQRLAPLSLLLLAFFIKSQQRQFCTKQFSEETFSRKEQDEEFSMSVVDLSTTLQNGKSARLQHHRQIACLHAKFRVMDQIPELYRHGLFAGDGGSRDGGEYDAFIRLSGASSTSSDRAPEARGMAIKVLGVAGEKLPLLSHPSSGEHCNANVQDFVLLSSDYFFTSSNKFYASMLKSFTAEGMLGVFRWALGAYVGKESSPTSYNPKTWQLSTWYVRRPIQCQLEEEDALHGNLCSFASL